MRRSSGGFTLMELLIVIGVLGILAVGLLAAIDPFEQLKKARDTNYRSALLEFLSANQRYYANHGFFPWRNSAEVAEGTCTYDNSVALGVDDTSTTASLSAALVKVGVDQDATFDPCIDVLMNDGELKSTFKQGLGKTLYLSSWGKTVLRVCYSPESKSNLNDLATAFHVNTDTNNVEMGCSTAQKSAGTCLQCFQ